MTALRLVDSAADSLPLHAVAADRFADWIGHRPGLEARWVEATKFKPDADAVLLLPTADGGLAGAAVIVDPGTPGPLWAYAAAADTLPVGAWRLAEPPAPADATRAALAWALAGYRFTRYKAPAGGLGKEVAAATLVWPEGADRGLVTATAEATFLARDLINTPAGDLGPAELAAAARSLAGRFGASCSVIEGDALLAASYPAVHAVGRASAKPPQLIDLRWGRDGDPLVTLVGKGVCFDSGGLDLKPSAGMKMMKKDMGGAATVLALASLVMAQGLRVRLRVLVPAVENMVAGNAFHPLDVLATRKGKTVEVGNTDAEGRLILCDALAEADAEAPALLIDCATLTGAARVALGPELPVMYARQDDLADELLRLGMAAGDPLWRLPLWPGYRRMLDSKVADISSTGDAPMAGSITAALFLAEFVKPATPWIHVDMYAWNARSRPGRPEGGEPQALRALAALIAARAKA